MKNYLSENVSKTLSELIFKIRSKTLDIKTQRQWEYEDNLCMGCEVKKKLLNT